MMALSNSRKNGFKFSEINHERKNHWNRAYFYEYSYEKVSKKKKVLDLGCGTGGFLKLGNEKIIGIDANFESLKKARRYSVNLVYGNILELPFSSASFDGINCSHVIEHFYPEDAYLLLLGMNRVLKIGGTLIISTPVFWQGFFDDFTHIRPYYPEAIMHYYGITEGPRTKRPIDCFYKLEEIKWRYEKVPMEPILFPKGGFLNTLLMILSRRLSSAGFGKYQKTGYTMILTKLR